MGNVFRFDLVFRYLAFLAEGLKNTILVSVLGLGIGLVIGVFIAMLRLTNKRVLNVPLSIYVDVFRSVPQLAVLFFFFYAIPIVTGVQVHPIISVAVALGLLCGAGTSEIFRGGILSIELGQWEAAYAIGMTRMQAYVRIILPQAIVRMLPPLVSASISMFKASALASAVGVTDLMWQADNLALYIIRRSEVFTVIAAMYFVLTYPQALMANYLHKRLLTAD